MKRGVNNISLKVIAILLFGLMCLMILDKAFFLHTHKLSDGTIIVHAHPYNKSADSKPFKTHHHSDTIFHFYHVVNLLFLTAFLTFTLAVSFKKVKCLSFQSKITSCRFVSYKKGRAPPSIFYSQSREISLSL